MKILKSLLVTLLIIFGVGLFAYGAWLTSGQLLAGGILLAIFGLLWVAVYEIMYCED